MSRKVEQRYSIEEVAVVSGKSTRSIYRDVYAGVLPAAKCGRVWRVKESDLERYLSMEKMTRFDQLRTGIIDTRSALTAEQRMALVGLLLANDTQA